MNRLKHLWGNLHASFWFLPALIVAFSTVLAVGLIEVDSSGSRDWMADWPRLFGAGAAGARGMLDEKLASPHLQQGCPPAGSQTSPMSVDSRGGVG